MTPPPPPPYGVLSELGVTLTSKREAWQEAVGSTKLLHLILSRDILDVSGKYTLYEVLTLCRFKERALKVNNCERREKPTHFRSEQRPAAQSIPGAFWPTIHFIEEKGREIRISQTKEFDN